MKKLSLILILITTVAFNFNANAQNVIAVEHLGVSSFYQNLDTALVHAVNGDMVYLPASSYNIGTLTINKGVHIVGAGSNVDSSLATGVTLFTGTLRIITGSDNGSIEGVYINGDIYFGTSPSDQAVNMFSIKRCVMNNVYLSYNGSASTASTNFSLSENIIKGYINGGNIQNVEITKCIIEGTINNFNGNALFSNNIFLKGTCDGYLLNTVTATIFQNNISLPRFCDNSSTWYLISSGTGNTFTNNMFVDAVPIPAGNTANGNLNSVPHDSIFVNQTGNLYNIAHNYHLRPTCIGKNAGTDGTDIGLYGTASPKKDGEIPFNPHVQTKAIPASTNSQGNLDINIKVKAQEN